MRSRTMHNGTALVAVVLACLSTAATAEKGGTSAKDGPYPLFDFARIDADGDGLVTKAEVEAFRAAQATKIDTDGNGKLDAAELQAEMLQRAGERAEKIAAHVIKERDSDGDGTLSVAEMAAGPQRSNLFDRVDQNADGAISRDELDAAKARMAVRLGEAGGKHRGRHGLLGWDDLK